MTVNKFLKPHLIISLQYFIISVLFIIYNNNNIYINNKLELLIYIYMPIIMYTLIYLILKIVSKNYKINVKEQSVFKSNSTYKIIELIIIIAIIINAISMFEMMHTVGQSNILSLFNKVNILYFQRHPGKILSMSIALMNIIPICVLIYYDYISKINNKVRKRKKSFIICIYMLESLVICSAAGIRFLFIVNSVPLLINITYYKRLNIRLIKKIILFFIVMGTIVIGGQAIKTQNLNIKDNVRAIEEYYTESISNVFYIIDNNYGKLNPDYWTIYRTFKGVPFVNFNKIDKWYIEKYGYIPIVDRDDDFEYVIRMGIQPKNNTFSVWGYSYLDYGQNGWILVAIQLIFIQILYTISIRNKKFEIFYQILVLFVIEQIRTNGIISSRTINAAIVFIILNVIDYIMNIYSSNK